MPELQNRAYDSDSSNDGDDCCPPDDCDGCPPLVAPPITTKKRVQKNFTN